MGENQRPPKSPPAEYFEHQFQELRSQYNFENKKKKIDSEISKHRQGKLWLVNNSSELTKKNIDELIQDIQAYFKI